MTVGDGGGPLTCKGCGGPITLRPGQTSVLPATTITFKDDEMIEQRSADDAWCGDCVDEWNQAMTDREAG